jgi:hypothetical protein
MSQEEVPQKAPKMLIKRSVSEREVRIDEEGFPI